MHRKLPLKTQRVPCARNNVYDIRISEQCLFVGRVQGSLNKDLRVFIVLLTAEKGEVKCRRKGRLVQNILRSQMAQKPLLLQ